MRLGCAGCLAAIVGLSAFAGAAWACVRMLQEPDVSIATATVDDGVRGQQKIYEILRGGDGRPKGHPQPITLSERELNGFLARHLAGAAAVPVSAVGLRLVGDGMVEFKGRLPLRHLVDESPFSAVADLPPAAWLERPVWLHLRARVRTEPGASRGQRRHLRLDVERFALGRQPLPVILLRLLLSPETLRIFRWPLPDAVEAVTIEAERVVIRTVS